MGQLSRGRFISLRKKRPLRTTSNKIKYSATNRHNHGVDVVGDFLVGKVVPTPAVHQGHLHQLVDKDLRSLVVFVLANDGLQRGFFGVAVFVGLQRLLHVAAQLLAFFGDNLKQKATLITLCKCVGGSKVYLIGEPVTSVDGFHFVAVQRGEAVDELVVEQNVEDALAERCESSVGVKIDFNKTMLFNSLTLNAAQIVVKFIFGSRVFFSVINANAKHGHFYVFDLIYKN